MSYQRLATSMLLFEDKLKQEVMEIIRYRSNELMAWITMRFLSSKSTISVRRKSGKLASSGSVVQPYRRGYMLYGGVKYSATDPKTGYNYAWSHFRLPGQSATVVIRPKNKQALAIPIEGAPTTYGGNTFARGNVLFIRNAFDSYDFTPVAVLAQQVTYPRRIDVEGMIWPHIIPIIKADIAEAVNRYRDPRG